MDNKWLEWYDIEHKNCSKCSSPIKYDRRFGYYCTKPGCSENLSGKLQKQSDLLNESNKIYESLKTVESLHGASKREEETRSGLPLQLPPYGLTSFEDFMMRKFPFSPYVEDISRRYKLFNPHRF